MHIFFKAKETLTQWKAKMEVAEKIKLEIDGLKIKERKINQAILDFRVALKALEVYKDNYKDTVISDLENNLNEVINSWFGEKYDLKIIEETRRGKTYTTLIDKNKGGELALICGDACQNSLQLLISIAILRLKYGDRDAFIFIDEIFSKFSEEMVTMIPSILNTLDFQIAIVEHKYKVLTPDENTYTYKVEMKDGVSNIKRDELDGN